MNVLEDCTLFSPHNFALYLSGICPCINPSSNHTLLRHVCAIWQAHKKSKRPKAARPGTQRFTPLVDSGPQLATAASSTPSTAAETAPAAAGVAGADDKRQAVSKQEARKSRWTAKLSSSPAKMPSTFPPLPGDPMPNLPGHAPDMPTADISMPPGFELPMSTAMERTESQPPLPPPETAENPSIPPGFETPSVLRGQSPTGQSTGLPAHPDLEAALAELPGMFTAPKPPISPFAELEAVLPPLPTEPAPGHPWAPQADGSGGPIPSDPAPPTPDYPPGPPPPPSRPHSAMPSPQLPPPLPPSPPPDNIFDMGTNSLLQDRGAVDFAHQVRRFGGAILPADAQRVPPPSPEIPAAAAADLEADAAGSIEELLGQLLPQLPAVPVLAAGSGSAASIDQLHAELNMLASMGSSSFNVTPTGPPLLVAAVSGVPSPYLQPTSSLRHTNSQVFTSTDPSPKAACMLPPALPSFPDTISAEALEMALDAHESSTHAAESSAPGFTRPGRSAHAIKSGQDVVGASQPRHGVSLGAATQTLEALLESAQPQASSQQPPSADKVAEEMSTPIDFEPDATLTYQQQHAANAKQPADANDLVGEAQQSRSLSSQALPNAAPSSPGEAVPAAAPSHIPQSAAEDGALATDREFPVSTSTLPPAPSRPASGMSESASPP